MGIIGDYVHVDITSNVAGTSSAKQRRLRDCAQGCASDGSEQGVAKSFRCGSSITLSGLFRLGKLFLQAKLHSPRGDSGERHKVRDGSSTLLALGFASYVAVSSHSTS